MFIGCLDKYLGHRVYLLTANCRLLTNKDLRMLHEDGFRMSDNPIRPPEDNDRVSRLSTAPRVQTEDELVNEYEMRYQEPRKRKVMPRSYSTMNVTDEEKLWAS